jgi:glucan 1,3-beta-glucosidase
VFAVLFVAAVLASLWWARQGQPVELVAAPGGRVQCVSYAPSSRRDETLVNPGVIVEPERIEQDLRLLAQRFDCVRTYSQSNGLAEVPRIARGLGLKVLMGVWLGRDEVMNRREIESAIRIAERDRDVLRGIVVGNEVLLRGELPPTALRGYIEQVRAATGVPVTYADVWEFWRKYREPIESAVDFITIHILP